MPIYSYLIRPYRVKASIEAEGPNDVRPINYEAEGATSGAIEAVNNRLSDAFGAFGHRFNADESSPIDLDAALISTFGLEAIERLTQSPSYDPGIPSGAQT